jgi:hypothetical protein
MSVADWMHVAFGGPSSNKGNTGPFWVGSGERIVFVFFCSVIKDSVV